MTTNLSEPQLDRLSALFAGFIPSVVFREPALGETEPKYTSTVLLPAARAWLLEMRKPALFLRADGGVPPRPVAFLGASFYPDLEVAHFEQRCLGIEVKFVRDLDRTGSIAKAVGQGSIYLEGGIKRCHIVLVDCRARRVRALKQVSVGPLTIHHVPAARGRGLSSET